MDYFTVIITAMIIIIAIVMVVWILLELQYKHIVIIREFSNNRKYIISDKAKNYTDENNVEWWKLKKEKNIHKKLMPIPPGDSIEITKRGKKYVETYRTELGEYIPIVDNGSIKDVPPDILEEMNNYGTEILEEENEKKKEFLISKHKNNTLLKWRKENNIIQPLNPVTREQRIAYVTGIKKAYDRKQSDWKKDLPMYLNLAGLMIIVILFLVFAPDIIQTYTKGKTDIMKMADQMEDKRHEYQMAELEEIAKISQGIQTINNEVTDSKKRIAELEKKQPD